MSEARLGKLLLKNKLVTAGQIQDALVKQLSTPEVPLGQILCQMGVLSADDLQLFLDRTHKRQKLGEILLKNRWIDQSGLNDAVDLSQRERIPLEKSLLKLNLVSEEHLARAIAGQYDLPYMDIAQLTLKVELSKIFNENFAQRHRIVPIASDCQSITVAMAFPLPRNELRQIEKFTQMQIIPVIAKERDIVSTVQQLYKIEGPAATINPALFCELSDESSSNAAGSITVGNANNANIDYLINKLLVPGISRGARDIHFESAENAMTVRYRIDGMLQKLDLGNDQGPVNANRQHIINKIKTICDMEIAERRRPQNGSFAIKAKKADDARRMDFRVSTVPSLYGEDMVIRISDKNAKIRPIENLGYFPDQIRELIQALHKPSGIFLVTGPTDAGKSSTLHAMLSKIISPETRTLTVEDTIEHVLEGITQTEVNESIGNTFSKMLRTFQHQDPDNLLIGEIRDPETATIALHMALTGRTVLSMIHANDATSVVARLLDFGIAPSIVSSTLRCVLAQRLIRHICRECSAPHTPSPETLKTFGLPSQRQMDLKKGRGCAVCNYTGYSGRRPIIELWLPTLDELALLDRKPDNIRLRQRVFSPGTRTTLLEDGFKKVLAGVTTLEELMRVVPSDHIVSDRDRLLPMLGA